MAQILGGLVQVTNGSTRVIGNAQTKWTEVASGHIFTVVGTDVWYQIAITTAPGSSTSGFWELTLANPYTGTTATNRDFAISRDFTPSFGIPYAVEGDIETASLFKRAMLTIEGVLANGQLKADTRRSIAVVVDSTVGNAFGIEQVHATQTGDFTAFRAFTANVTNAYLAFGKYTTATAFDEFGRFKQDGVLQLNRNSMQMGVTSRVTIQQSVTANRTLTLPDASGTVALTSQLGDAAQLTTGLLPVARLPDSGVAPGTYGDATNSARITVDQYGRLTAVTTQAITATAGEANTASNVGAGVGVYKQKVGVDLQFKTLVQGTGITITGGADTITFSIGSVGVPSVVNIVALKAVDGTSLATNTLYQVHGYYTANDGGGGTFIFVAGSSATADDGYVIAPTSGGGRFFRVITRAGFRSVDQFGAKGDGSTVDNTAITNCFSSAVAGTTISFSNGRTYVMTNLITIGVDDITVLGTGAKIISTATGQDRKFTATGRNGIRFRDVVIDGGAYTTLAGSPSTWAFDTFSPRDTPGTIHFADCTRCEVTGGSFKGLNFPVTILGNCSNIRVDFNTFETYTAAVYAYFSDASGQPSPTYISVCHNMFWAGKYPIWTATTPPTARAYPPAPYNCTGAIKFRAAENVDYNVERQCVIQGNRITDPGQMGIEIQGGMNDTTVSANTIRNPDIGISLSTIQRVVVSGNTIKNHNYTGIELDGRPTSPPDDSDPSTEECSIIGNIIDGRDSYGRPVNWVNNYGITCANETRGVSITGGVIKYCKTAIDVHDYSKNITITGVRIQTNEESGDGGIGGYTGGSGHEAWVQGIHVGDGSHDVTISGCEIIQSGAGQQRLISILNASNVRVRGCSLTSNNICVRVSQSTNVTIEGGDFYSSSNIGGTKPSFILLQDQANANLVIDGVKMRGEFTNAVYVDQSSGVVMRNCTITPTGTGNFRTCYFAASSNITMRDCTVTSNGTHVYVHDSSSVRVIGGEFFAGTAPGGSLSAYLTIDSTDTACSNIVFQGVKMVGNMPDGIFLYSPAHSITNVLLEALDTRLATSTGSDFLTLSASGSGTITGIDVRENFGPGNGNTNANVGVPVPLLTGTVTDSPKYEVITIGSDTTVNLQTAVGYNGKRKRIILTTTFSTCTLHPVGSETINGVTGNQVITAQWGSVELFSDGSNWRMIRIPRFGTLQYVSSATFTNDFGTVAAGNQAYVNVTVDCPGGTTGDPSVSVGWSGNLPVGVVFKQALVSGTNQVTVVIANYTGGGIAVGTLSGRVTVQQFSS